MRLHLAAGAVLVLALSACGLDRWGEEIFVEAGAPAEQPSAVPELDADVADADADADATDQLFPSGPTAKDDAGVRFAPADDAGAADASIVPLADGASPSGSGAVSDAASDAVGPCARLATCCPNLLIPQATIPCLLVATQDGGDTQCEMSLATLADAGICP
jgi:hypothetical protein